MPNDPNRIRPGRKCIFLHRPQQRSDTAFASPGVSCNSKNVSLHCFSNHSLNAINCKADEFFLARFYCTI